MATLALALPTVLRGDLDSDTAAAFVAAGRVAWDLETSGLDWRESQIETCQLYNQAVGCVIVQVNGEVPQVLAELLSDARVEKIFHHAPFDLRFMFGSWGVTAARVACTKVASKVIWPTLANGDHSLQSLLARVLGVRIDKGERLSNWAAHDLTAQQVSYAANDVAYLLELIEALRAEAETAGVAHLVERCFEHLPTRAELEARSLGDVFAY